MIKAVNFARYPVKEEGRAKFFEVILFLSHKNNGYLYPRDCCHRFLSFPQKNIARHRWPHVFFGGNYIRQLGFAHCRHPAEATLIRHCARRYFVYHAGWFNAFAAIFGFHHHQNRQPQTAACCVAAVCCSFSRTWFCAKCFSADPGPFLLRILQ